MRSITRVLFVGATVVACAFSSAALAGAATLTVCKSGCAYSSFQAALNAALPGDTILLRAGETFVGNFTLPAKGSSTAFITIRSDAADSQFPADGVRLVPSDRSGSNTARSLLPRLLGQGGAYRTAPVLRTAGGAHHYRLKFLEIDGSANEGYESVVLLGDDKADTPIAHDIVMDRVYVHGHRYKGQKRGIALNGQAISILNSYIADIKAVSTDSQALAGYNGAGPFHIVNNYLEASAENIMFGGSGPAITNLVPADIEIRRNHLFKPTSWQKDILAAPASPRASATTGGSLSSGTHYFRIAALMKTGARTATSIGSAQVSATVGSSGAVTLSWSGVGGAEFYRIYRGTASGKQTVYLDTPGSSTSYTYKGSSEHSGTPPSSGTRWVVKNLLELKNAERVQIEGNVLENVWKAGQAGYAIMLTPRNANGIAVWSRVQDVTIANNLIRHAAGGINVLGIDDSGSSGRTRRVTVRNNVFYDIDPAKYGGLAKAFLFGDGPDAITVDHNTIVHNANALVHGYGDPTTGFRFTNNNANHGKYGIMGDGTQPGNNTLSKYFPGAVVSCNVLAGGNASLYPATNTFPTLADWNASFVSPSTGDYSLRAGSVVAQLGCAGVPPGADFTELSAALAGTSDSSTGGDPPPAGSNEPPTAQAGGPYATAPGSSVTVNGSASSDSDGSITAYRWTWGDEVLVRAADLPSSAVHGSEWVRGTASGAAGGVVMNNPDRGAAKRATALASPTSYVEFQVRVAAGVPYKLWMRMKAGADSVSNDSMHLQFSAAVDRLGAPLARIGTTSSLSVLLEDGRGAYVSGWGWNDEDYEGIAQPVYFAQSGVQTIRVQQREDGVMWDELVLSSGQYLRGAPGTLKNDTTTLSTTFGTSTGVTASHTYTVAGVFPLLLTVTDDGGAQGTDDATVNVGTGGGLVADAGGPYTAAPGSPVVFDGSDSSVPTGVTAAYEWTFGDDIVLRGPDFAVQGSRWQKVSDGTAAGGVAALNPNLGQAKISTPLASPSSYIEATFQAATGVPYRVWFRMRADGNSYDNDSIHVQFSGTVTSSGSPAWRIGSTQSVQVVLEEGRGAGVYGWGWNDGSYGALAEPVYFATSGPQTVRIQQREDGVRIDQIIVSTDAYYDRAPGTVTSDSTIVPQFPADAIGVQVQHTYSRPASYPATLRLRAGSSLSSDTATVTIR